MAKMAFLGGFLAKFTRAGVWKNCGPSFHLSPEGVKHPFESRRPSPGVTGKPLAPNALRGFSRAIGRQASGFRLLRGRNGAEIGIKAFLDGPIAGRMRISQLQ